jgi:hypothetical protein
VALDGELCKIARYGPVPVSVIQDLVATERPDHPWQLEQRRPSTSLMP